MASIILMIKLNGVLFEFKTTENRYLYVHFYLYLMGFSFIKIACALFMNGIISYLKYCFTTVAK